jgi:hypothetical protein
MFRIGTKTKPAKKLHPRDALVFAVNRAVADARAAGVDVRTIATKVENSAEVLRVQWACTAPLWQAP